jgi:anti-anti-sigma factor
MSLRPTVAPLRLRHGPKSVPAPAAGDGHEAKIADAQPRAGLLLALGRPTIALSGALTWESAAALEAAIERACERTGAERVTLDLRRLQRIDWAGMRVIAFRCRLCASRGHELVLLAGPPAVQEAFARAGLLDELPFVKLSGAW